VEANASLGEKPETINEDPYGQGWMVRVRLSDPSERESLMDAEAYRAKLG
jgi:glycine cleavage system H protein